MGAYTKKKKKSSAPAGKGWVRPVLWVVIALLVLVLIGGLLLVFGLQNTVGVEDPTVGGTTEPSLVPETTEPTVPDATMEQTHEYSINLGHGLELTKIGRFSGVYMEDGTDEMVSNVLMVMVTNNGEEDIQYSEVILAAGNTGAFFDLTTLPAGETVLLLERDRMQWSETETYSNAMLFDTAVFPEPLDLHSDQLQVQMLDGAMNVTNISSEDISGEIVIYYKNRLNDMYYGGITYRVRIEGGLAADEVRQLPANHLYANGSQIVFITIA